MTYELSSTDRDIVMSTVADLGPGDAATIRKIHVSRLSSLRRRRKAMDEENAAVDRTIAMRELALALLDQTERTP